MNTIIIQPNSQADYRLFIELAKRLKAKFSISPVEMSEKQEINSTNDKETKFFELFGSFDLPETSDELIEIIENSRTSKDIDASWTQ